MINNICFYVFGYPPDYSGATNQAIRLAKYLNTIGISCQFVTYSYAKEKCNKKENVIFPLKRFHRPINNMFIYHLNALKALFSVRKNIENIYINGNDGQFWTACYLACFAKIFGIKIFMELNMDYDDPLNISMTKCEKLKKICASFIDGYICLSSIIKQKMDSHYPSLNSHLIFNGVNTKKFSPVKNSVLKNKKKLELGLNLDDTIVISCGAICRRKGVDFLLDVWEEVISNRKNIRLLLLGPFTSTDDEDDQFAQMIQERAMSKEFCESITFCGNVNNVEDYFSVANLFVFAGRQEGSPNVIREALSSGLPVVSLGLDGITEDMVKNGKNGYIVKVEEQNKLNDYMNKKVPGRYVKNTFVKYVNRITCDPTLAKELSKNAREIAIEKFSIEKQANRLVELICSIGNIEN